MKILYILPNGTVKSGGNWVTATRLSKGLQKRGITVEIIEAKDVTKELLIKYDVIHAFHAFKALAKISHLLADIDKTIVVSFTGTDIKQLQEMGESKVKIIDLLNKTEAIIVFHDAALEELIKEGIFRNKVKVIPQTAMFIEKECRGKKQSTENSTTSNCVSFLFAAGIRKVKAPLEVIEMMSSLVEKVGNIRLVLVGPILEKDLGEKVKKKIKGKRWIKYLGEVSHQEVQNFIAESDIVINASISEGMSNTLLEAQHMGKPILATDIDGNRAIVSHSVNGFLFKNAKEFEYYATKLVKDPKLREEMGSSAFKTRQNYGWTQEISMYESVYRA